MIKTQENHPSPAETYGPTRSTSSQRATSATISATSCTDTNLTNKYITPNVMYIEVNIVYMSMSIYIVNC